MHIDHAVKSGKFCAMCKHEKLSAKAQPDGRIAYTVYGVVTVYSMQEAVNLMDTGAFQIDPEILRLARREPICEVDATTSAHCFPVPA